MRLYNLYIILITDQLWNCKKNNANWEQRRLTFKASVLQPTCFKRCNFCFEGQLVVNEYLQTNMKNNQQPKQITRRLFVQHI